MTSEISSSPNSENRNQMDAAAQSFAASTVVQDTADATATPVTSDAIAPKAPTITSAIDDAGGATASFISGSVIDDNTPTFHGTAEPNVIVELYGMNERLLGSVRADANGNWSFTVPALAEGFEQVGVKAVDDAGNRSGWGNNVKLTVDTLSPSATITHGTDDTGSIIGDFASGRKVDDTTPTLHGTASAAGIVKIYEGDVLKGSVATDASGQWSFTPGALSEGRHTFTASLTPEGSNEGPRIGAFDFTVDTVAPKAPSITSAIDSVGSKTGIFASGSIIDDNTPTFHGTAQANVVVELYGMGQRLLGSTRADASGKWSFTVPALADGFEQVGVKAVDDAGNRSGWGNNVKFTVDTSPNVSIAYGYDGAGGITGNFASGATVDDTTPTLHGYANPHGKLWIYVDNVLKGDATADASGKWSHTLSGLGNGQYSVSAVLMNDWVPVVRSAEFVINVSVAAVDTPVITSVVDDVGSKAGHVEANGMTDDLRPEVQGTAGAGHLVKLYDGTVLLGSVVADASGQWSFTPAADFALGQHQLIAEAMDAVGNRSAKTQPWSITVGVDTEVVSITHGYDGAGGITGNFASGATVDDTTPTLHGQATPHGQVWIYVDNVLKGNVTADASGNWSHTLSGLGNGQYSVSAALMNGWTEAARSAEFVINVGVATVDMPVITSVVDDVGSKAGHVEANGMTDDLRPEVQGTAGAGHLVKLYDGTVLLGSVVADASGQWSFTPAADFALGQHQLIAEAMDAVGNRSAKTQPWSITVGVDTEVVSITHGYDGAGGITGNFASGATVDDTTPTLHGQATPHGQVWIYVDNVFKGNVTADASGNWSKTLSGLSDGPHSISAALMDGWAEASRSAEFVINVATPPVVGTIDMRDDGDNVLNLSVSDVLQQGGKDLFHVNGDVQMRIKGDAGDTVNLEDMLADGMDSGDWVNAGDTAVNGVSYVSYQHSTLEAELLVQQGVTVNLV